jgi:transposase-like protein
MKIKIELYCPHCLGTKIKKNGMKSYGKQNYLCKTCGRQFIGDHAPDYKGCHSLMIKRILLMMVRGVGVRDPYGKKHTVGIEGNNCRLRHRIRPAFRKTCCFSKIIRNHLKAFNLAFFYINFGYI